MPTPWDEELTPEEEAHIRAAAKILEYGPPHRSPGDPWADASDFCRFEHYWKLQEFGDSLPQKIQHGAIEQIFGFLVSRAVFELQEGAVRRFPAFAALFYRFMGAPIEPFLPSLYLAAVLHPGFLSNDIDTQDACELIAMRENLDH